MNEKAQNALNQVIEKMKAGDLSPVVEIIQYPPPEGIPAQAWTLPNRFMAYMQTGCLDCRGFRQWQQAGRQVIKGSKAAYILGPRMIKTTDEETGEQKQILIGFFGIPVFPLEATNGDPLPEYDHTPAAMPPLHDVALALGCSVRWTPTPEGTRGSFHPSKNHITLGTAEEKVFFHELGHAAHNKISPIKGGQDPQQELIAEFTACVLMRLYLGKDYSGNAWEYISGYNPDDPIKAIFKALGMIEKVLDLITTEAIQ